MEGFLNVYYAALSILGVSPRSQQIVQSYDVSKIVVAGPMNYAAMYIVKSTYGFQFCRRIGCGVEMLH